MKTILIIGLLLMLQQASFKETQLKKLVLRLRMNEKDTCQASTLRIRSFPWISFNFLLRAFKKEQILKFG
jgi:hypothetical protein